MKTSKIMFKIAVYQVSLSSDLEFGEEDQIQHSQLFHGED